jgi:short-subunit dehydrogenase
MDKQTVLVTGASSGIALTTAMGVAQMGAHVLLVARDRTRGEAARTGGGTGSTPDY